LKSKEVNSPGFDGRGKKKKSVLITGMKAEIVQ
jgi:hypothetical protein